MRFPSLVLALAGAVAMTGCSWLVGLNPFVTDRDAVREPALAGVWSGDNRDATYLIKQDGLGYAITYTEKSEATNFKAQVMKVGDAELLDLVCVDERPFFLPVHMVVRVWSGGVRWQLAQVRLSGRRLAPPAGRQTTGDLAQRRPHVNHGWPQSPGNCSHEPNRKDRSSGPPARKVRQTGVHPTSGFGGEARHVAVSFATAAHRTQSRYPWHCSRSRWLFGQRHQDACRRVCPCCM